MNLPMDIIGSFVRSGLMAAGAGLVTNGTISSSQEQQAVGAVMTLLGLAWSVYQKLQQRKVVVAAVNTPAPSVAVTTHADAVAAIAAAAPPPAHQ
jgi:hypothetical protein